MVAQWGKIMEHEAEPVDLTPEQIAACQTGTFKGFGAEGTTVAEEAIPVDLTPEQIAACQVGTFSGFENEVPTSREMVLKEKLPVFK